MAHNVINSVAGGRSKSAATGCLLQWVKGSFRRAPRGAAWWSHNAGLTHLGDLQLFQCLPAAQQQACDVGPLQLRVREESTQWLELPWRTSHCNKDSLPTMQMMANTCNLNQPLSTAPESGSYREFTIRNGP